MSFTVKVYKNGILLGSGTAADEGVTQLTSYSAEASRVTGQGRNVQMATPTAGKVWNTRVLPDASTLVFRDACPFAA